MSDTPTANQPPPPPSVPPPPFGAAAPAMPPYQVPAGYQVPPGYQGPTAPDYVTPHQYPQPAPSGSLALGAILSSPGALLYQFGGYALYSCIAGLAAIIVPFVAGLFFPSLPIIRLLNRGPPHPPRRGLRGIVGARA